MGEDTTRRGFLLAAGAGTVTAMAGCSGGTNSATTPSTSTQTTSSGGTDTTTTTQTSSAGGTLQLARKNKIESLDPVVKATGAPNQWAERLMGYNNGLLPPTPKLATGYKTSNGGKTYTFSLRKDATFHNGKPLTAKDFVYSWERIAQSPHSQNTSDVIGGTFTLEHQTKTVTKNGKKQQVYKPGSLAVKAVDKHTFQFTAKQPFHAALALIATKVSFAAISEGTVGDITRSDVKTSGKYSYQEAFGTKNGGPKVSGTGPFKLDSWSPGSALSLSKYDNYWGQVANIDGIKYTILSSWNAIYTRAENGNLDIWTRIPSGKYDPKNANLSQTLKGGRQVGTYEMQNQKVNYGTVSNMGTAYLLFNCSRVAKPVRQAIAMIINQHEIANSIYTAGAKPAYTMTPSVTFPTTPWGGNTTHVQAYESFVKTGAHHQTEFGKNGYPWGYNKSDIQGARKLMENKGHSSSNPASVTFTIISGDSHWQQIAKMIQSKGKAAHIDVKINSADFNTIINQGGIKHQMDFFAMRGSPMEWPEGDNLLHFLPPKAASAKYGFTQWGTKKNGEWATKAQRLSQQAWDQNYVPHKGPGQTNQQHRDHAYLTVEEANWNGVTEFPLVFPRKHRYWSSQVQNYEMPGVMGETTYNKITLNRK